MAEGSMGFGWKFDVIDVRKSSEQSAVDIETNCPFVGPNIVQWYRTNTDSIDNLPVTLTGNYAAYVCVIGHSATNIVRYLIISGSNSEATNIYIHKHIGSSNGWYKIEGVAVV